MISKEKKAGAVEKFKQHPTDTGSTSVQVAILTTRIQAVVWDRQSF
jgi:ribosomal protein S15P/S13E